MLGRPCEVAHVPVEALVAQKAAATDSLDESFAGLLLRTAQEGQAIEMDSVLQLFPVELSSVRDYAQALVGAVQTS